MHAGVLVGYPQPSCDPGAFVSDRQHRCVVNLDVVVAALSVLADRGLRIRVGVTIDATERPYTISVREARFLDDAKRIFALRPRYIRGARLRNRQVRQQADYGRSVVCTQTPGGGQVQCDRTDQLVQAGRLRHIIHLRERRVGNLAGRIASVEVAQRGHREAQKFCRCLHVVFLGVDAPREAGRWFQSPSDSVNSTDSTPRLPG
ncbi:hypothetical protein GALL_527630 [mine drainage metagenome]|uniref:Uncharacterized protein n=1 Tax=mine drainage metagenome TaxID=410659 RepID=A0A1J5PQ29_9ZZZZ